jgi:tuftelin-interacting protein 11
MSDHTFKFGIGKEIKNNNFYQGQGEKSKQEDPYGMIYGDVFNNLSEMRKSSESEETQSTGAFIRSNFVRGTTENATQPNVTVKERTSEEFLRNDMIEDFVKEEETNKLEDKKEAKKHREKYGKGHSMLKKIGWKGAGGLGKNEQGITAPIEPVLRKGKQGINARDRVDGKDDSEEEEDILDGKINFKNQKNQKNQKNKKEINELLGKKRIKKEKKIDKAREELDEFEKLINNYDSLKNMIKTNKYFDFEEQNIFDISKIILDGGRKANLQSHCHVKQAISYDFKKENFEDYKELKETIVNIMKHTKHKLAKHVNSLKCNEDDSFNYDFQIQEINNKIKENDIKKLNKEQFLTHLQSLSTIEVKQNVIEYIQKVSKLYDHHKYEYKSYLEISTFVLNNIIFMMKSKYSFKDYMLKSTEIITILKLVRDLLEKTLNEEYEKEISNESHIFAERGWNKEKIKSETKSDKYYTYFLLEIIVKELINFIINIWNVKENDKIVHVLTAYDLVFPHKLKSILLESAMMPKIENYIKNVWDPYTDNMLIHIWLHSLLSILGLDNCQKIYKWIQEKIEENILNYDITNLKIIELLVPWKKIFGEEYIEGFTSKFLIPKLHYLISKLEVNPAQQNIEPLKILLMYNKDLIPVERTAFILKASFFPKWLNTLHSWLQQGECSKDKFEEIMKWYQGWKNLFKNYLELPAIQKEFTNANNLILNALK